MILITVSRNYQVFTGRVKTQSILDFLLIQKSHPVEHILIVNLPEVLSRTPGHLIRRVQIDEVIHSGGIQYHPVITPLEDDIVPVQDGTPLVDDGLQNLWFDTVPGDVKGVVELSEPIVPGYSVGTGSQQEEITIRTPGLVELIPDCLEVFPLVLAVLDGIHLGPHPDIFIKKTRGIPFDGIPQVNQISVYVRTDTPVHAVRRRTQQLEEDGTSPTERFIICVYETWKILDNLFTLYPFASNPFY